MCDRTISCTIKMYSAFSIINEVELTELRFRGELYIYLSIKPLSVFYTIHLCTIVLVGEIPIGRTSL